MRRYSGALVILEVIVITLWLAGLASAVFNPGDIEWASAVTGTLNKGSTLTDGEYMVKAVQFPSPVQGIKDVNGNWIPETDVDPMVYLEVYKNGSLIKELIMTRQSEAYIDPDYEVKISATDFMSKNAKEWIFQFYNPWVTASMQIRAKPKLEVKVSPDKAVYTPYDDTIITAKVTVTNSGEASARNVDVNLNTGELQLRGGSTGQLHQYYYKLEKGMSQSFEVILVVPELIDERSYNLSADAKGYDIKELEYRAMTGSVSVAVSPRQNYFTISKAVKDNLYLRNTATVRITVGNGGMFDIYNIHINDSMNQNFELESNTSFQWDIPVLKPGQEWGATYSIRPLEANLNGFIIPAAAARFTVNNKQYNASSKTTTVVVNGPRLILNKTVDKHTVNISEDVKVTVNINNSGNIATRAEVEDSLPDGVSLINGSISQANFSEPKMPWGFSYIIRMNTDGKVELPAAVANYTEVEYRGAVRAVISSNRPVITVIDPSKIPPPPSVDVNSTSTATIPQAVAATLSPAATTVPDTTVPAPTPAMPGVNSAATAVVLVIAAVYRRR